jgi:hypothetical protein
MTVPPSDDGKFQEGARESIAAVFSPELGEKLAAFMMDHARDPKIATAWNGYDAPRIVDEERAHYTSAIGITTYDGAGALFYKILKHNIAFEGRTDPDGGRDVPMNRFALPGRTAGDIANTIAHEVSHAAGLTHPDSDEGRLPRAFCEPPYVIGTIVQQVAEGADWRWSSAGDCACLKPDVQQEACVP